MYTVHDLVLEFRQLIIASWPIVERLDKQDTFEVFAFNWLEANWELFIEGMLNKDDDHIYIAHYDGGGDFLEYGYENLEKCYPLSSRYFFPNQEPTHWVVAQKIGADKRHQCAYNKDYIDFSDALPFEFFCTLDNAELKEPFSYAQLTYNDMPVYARYDEVIFTLAYCTIDGQIKTRE